MPGFTSVTFQQQSSTAQPLLPAAPDEEDQLGSGIGKRIATEIIQSAAKSAKATKNAGRAASTAAVRAKAKYMPLGKKLDDLEPLVPSDDAAKKALKGASASKTEQLVDKVIKTAAKTGDKLKNKKLSEIVQEAGTAKKKVKRVTSEIAKRGGKKLLAAAAAGGVTAGVGVAVDYLKHVGEGKEPLSGSDLRKIAVDAGVSVAKKGLEGKLSKQGVEKEILNSYNRIISTKKGAKPGPKSVNLVGTLGKVQKLLRRLNKIHWRKHYKTNGEAPLGLLDNRPFGSGAMARRSRGGTRGRKGVRSRRSRVGKKKHSRKSRKARTKKRGRKCRSHNSRSKLMKRMHDVFDVY